MTDEQRVGNQPEDEQDVEGHGALNANDEEEDVEAHSPPIGQPPIGQPPIG